MIRIACTNCREVLTIDDAFAGGVCRCQHCGTIQTVPATAAAGGGGTAGDVAVGGPNLGGGRVASASGSSFGAPAYGDGTGLDDLAGAVASSGLSSRRLLRPDGTPAGRPAAASTLRPAGSRQNLVPLFAAAGVVIVLLLGVIAYLALHTAPPATPPVAPPSPQVRVVAVAANFCGTPLTGDAVVYVLDRGTATQEIFDPLKEATLKSIASLGSDHHFQVVFWPNTGEDPTAYPQAGTAYATRENVVAARRIFEDVSAYGQTDAKPAIALALAQHPDLIVLATAKGWVLDDPWTQDVLAARGPGTTRFDTFSLGSAPPPSDAGGVEPPLKVLADRTGGTFTRVGNDELKAAAE